jgi:predicted RNase H-like HicB family nuclease
MTEYVAILEHARDGSWSAYVPDLPGCTSAGLTREEVSLNVRDAIAGHIETLRDMNIPVPAPTSLAEVVQVG